MLLVLQEQSCMRSSQKAAVQSACQPGQLSHQHQETCRPAGEYIRAGCFLVEKTHSQFQVGNVRRRAGDELVDVGLLAQPRLEDAQ